MANWIVFIEISCQKMAHRHIDEWTLCMNQLNQLNYLLLLYKTISQWYPWLRVKTTNAAYPRQAQLKTTLEVYVCRHRKRDHENIQSKVCQSQTATSQKSSSNDSKSKIVEWNIKRHKTRLSARHSRELKQRYQQIKQTKGGISTTLNS